MTAIDRRSFLAALSATIAASGGSRLAFAGTPEPLFVSASLDSSDAAYVAVFALDGRMLFNTRLPERGHDIAIRPFSEDLVVFARRPGNWAAIIDRNSGNVTRVVTSPPGRHFYGHGVFSADGGLLYATENAMATGDGVLGIYDATADYRRVGEMPSYGIGPHDLAFLPGHRHIVVANGGIKTHPGTGREILNKDEMEPSLALVDPQSGSVLVKTDLGAALKGLSIRHLAVTAAGTTVFGCQFEGDPNEMPPLVGVMTPDGKTRFLDMPEDDLGALQNYVGSVSLDASGKLAAATSPRGNTIAFWDVSSGQYLGRRRMSDVCGVAAAPIEGVLLATSGNSGVRLAPVATQELKRLGGTELDRWTWDNHLRRL
ncbi:DUF1513 domain-containing protein [Microvirga flavescens]|uniref:DUF1513 domain-containing protein n=1 Tax=Microvirga flavescens TaxID=2249811 RepID=UPI000DDAB885|nr:DUF1513 domain-containing protein [Microvirga flavescens]